MNFRKLDSLCEKGETLGVEFSPCMFTFHSLITDLFLFFLSSIRFLQFLTVGSQQNGLTCQILCRQVWSQESKFGDISGISQEGGQQTQFSLPGNQECDHDRWHQTASCMLGAEARCRLERYGAEKQPRGDGVPPPKHRHVDEQEKNSSTNGKNEEYRSWEKKVELLSFEGQDLWAGLLEPKNFGCGTLSQQRRFR